jgi:hypothetical protein
MIWLLVGMVMGWLIPMPQVLKDAAADIAVRTPMLKNWVK